MINRDAGWLVPFSSDLRSDEVALLGMRDCLESSMGSQLLIDLGEMIAQGLRTDPERLCNARSTASCCELLKDLESWDESGAIGETPVMVSSNADTSLDISLIRRNTSSLFFWTLMSRAR